MNLVCNSTTGQPASSTSYIPQDKVAYLILQLNNPGMVPAFLVPYRIKRTSGIPTGTVPSNTKSKKLKEKPQEKTPRTLAKPQNQNKIKTQTKTKNKQKKQKPNQTKNPHKLTGKKKILNQRKPMLTVKSSECTATYQTQHFLYLSFLRAVFLVTLWTLPAIWQFLVK